MRTLSSRQWVAAIWATYIVVPTVVVIVPLIIGSRLLPAVRSTDYIGVVAAPAVLIQLAIPILAIVFVGGAILKPLKAMSVAAHQVAQHDLDFSLPASHVREVNEATTAFSAMRDELHVALVRQAELEQERQFFISAIAHDLHSPLFALRGYLEGLEVGVAATPERSRHYLHICQAKVSELERLAADLFSYTQVDRLEQTMHREPLDLGLLLRDTSEGIRPKLDEKRLTLTLKGRMPFGCCLLDSHLMRRAITNVLENAVSYTPEGGEITLSWSVDGDHCLFTVTDTGPGIAAQDLPYLFAPFYRGEESRNRNTGGAGLGLAIARRIVQAHGGTLTAMNNPGGGALFQGTLPRIVATPSETTAL
jgi:signal transduction histidine kinase